MEIFDTHTEVERFGAVTMKIGDESLSVIGDVNEERVNALAEYTEFIKGNIEEVSMYSYRVEESLVIRKRNSVKWHKDTGIVISMKNSDRLDTTCYRIAYQWKINEIFHIYSGRKSVAEVVAVKGGIHLYKENNRPDRWIVIGKDSTEVRKIKKFIGGEVESIALI